jgi:hypothetical protein
MTKVAEALEPETMRIVALAKHISAEAGATFIYPEAFAVAMLRFKPNTATRVVEQLCGNVDKLLVQCREQYQERMHNYTGERRSDRIRSVCLMFPTTVS